MVTDPAQNTMTPASVPITCSEEMGQKTIKVNQVGYLPERKKVAYVGDYLGDNEGGVWAVGANGAVWYWNRINTEYTKLVNIPTTRNLLVL